MKSSQNLTDDEVLTMMCALEMVLDAMAGVPIKPSDELTGEDAEIDAKLDAEFTNLHDKLQTGRGAQC